MDGNIVQLQDDGRIVYRASALGGCTKALILARMGFEPEPTPESFKAYDRGHAAEQPILDKLVEDGWHLDSMSSQMEVTIPVTTTISVVGHIDGVGYRDDPWHVIDAKSQNQTEWDNFLRNPWSGELFAKYKWQFSCYMHALQMQAVLARGLWDAENERISTVQWQIVERPFYSLAEIRGRVLAVEAAARQSLIPDACDKRSYPCPYWKFHEDDREYVEDQELQEAAREYLSLQREEKRVKEEKSRVQGEILSRVGKKYKANVGGGVVLSTWEQAAGPTQYDIAKMKEDGVDVDKYVKPKVKSPRVKVTVDDDNDNKKEGSDAGVE